MDALIRNFDRALSTLAGVAHGKRPMPNMAGPSKSSAHNNQQPLSENEQRKSIALMRVNHAGEVAAQALYQGQALTAKNIALKTKLSIAADEELDHLLWTRERVHELGGRTSVLNPLWYAGAFAIGATAGLMGDQVSLGFLKATEEQVEAHLASHLDRIPLNDHTSRALVEQMKLDEAAHASMAQQLGAKELPRLIQRVMRHSAKVMTTLAEKI